MFGKVYRVGRRFKTGRMIYDNDEWEWQWEWATAGE